MYIPRLRRISDVVKEVKQLDPDTALTDFAIRELIKKGSLTQMKYGNSWLINLDELYAIFTKGENIECDE